MRRSRTGGFPSGKTDHGRHLHFAVSPYIKRHLIEQAWDHGLAHTKLLGDLPAGSGVLGEKRLAARYKSKYVSKPFERGVAERLHRYEVAQGFQPQPVVVWGRTVTEALDRASERMRSRPEYVWRSEDEADWQGPPTVWASWPG